VLRLNNRKLKMQSGLKNPASLELLTGQVTIGHCP